MVEKKKIMNKQASKQASKVIVASYLWYICIYDIYIYTHIFFRLLHRTLTLGRDICSYITAFSLDFCRMAPWRRILPSIKWECNVCGWKSHIEKTKSTVKQENSEMKADCIRQHLRKMQGDCYEVFIFFCWRYWSSFCQPEFHKLPIMSVLKRLKGILTILFFSNYYHKVCLYNSGNIRHYLVLFFKKANNYIYLISFAWMYLSRVVHTLWLPWRWENNFEKVISFLSTCGFLRSM